VRFLSGIRGRVLLAVLAASALAYSAAATLGFLRVANASRDAMRERIGEVLDALETELRGGVASARASTPDGVEAFVVPGDATLGGVATDEIRVVRRRQVGGTEVVLVGRASSRRLGESLRALHRGLWTAVPVAVVLTAFTAALAVARTLRPVADITRLAATIGSGDARQRAPVPDTTDEIEALARTVNGMLDRIGAGVAAQRQFTSDAAHELRTPLMALAAEIELAARPGQWPILAVRTSGSAGRPPWPPEHRGTIATTSSKESGGITPGSVPTTPRKRTSHSASGMSMSARPRLSPCRTCRRSTLDCTPRWRTVRLMEATTKKGRWNVRVTPAQDAVVRRVLEETGESLNDYIVRSTVHAAETDLADRRVFVADDASWSELQALLDAPPVLKPELAKLLSAPSVLEQRSRSAPGRGA